MYTPHHYHSELVKLLLNLHFEFKKALINITFIEYRIQPSKTVVIIYKDNIKFATSQGWNRGGPNIRVDKFQGRRGLPKRLKKRQLLGLA